jgi:hypothetical protein
VRLRPALEQREEVLDAVDRAPEVDGHDPLDVRERDLLDRAVQRDARVVNQHVRAAVALLDFAREALDARAVGHVHSVRRYARAPRRERARSLFERARVYVRKTERRALVSEARREGAPYPRGSARQNRDLTFEASRLRHQSRLRSSGRVKSSLAFIGERMKLSLAFVVAHSTMKFACRVV